MALRYSTKIGPFRINLLKSGSNYSFGMKGARINTDLKGTVTFTRLQSTLYFIDSTCQRWYKSKYQDSLGYVDRHYSSLDSLITNTHVFKILVDHSTNFWILLNTGLDCTNF